MWSSEELTSVNLVKSHDIKYYYFGKKGKTVQLEALNANECISYVSGLFAAAGVYHEQVDFMRVLYITMEADKRALVARVLRELGVTYTETGDRMNIDNDTDNLIRFHRFILPLDDMSKLIIASPYHMDAVRYERTKRLARSRRAVVSAA